MVTELGKAFDNNGENLRTFVDSLSNLSKSGIDNLPQTISLIRNSDTVLTTQAAQSDEILNWSRGLTLVTAQLATSDPDLRRLLTTGRRRRRSCRLCIERSGGRRDDGATDLAKDVGTSTAPFRRCRQALRSSRQSPVGSYTRLPGDGSASFRESPRDEQSTRMHHRVREDATIIAEEEKRKNRPSNINYDGLPVQPDAKCALPQGSPSGVRGAQNAVYADTRFSDRGTTTPRRTPTSSTSTRSPPRSAHSWG